MYPATSYTSTSLALNKISRLFLHSCAGKAILSFTISVLFSFSSLAQDSTIKFVQSDFKEGHGDSIRFSKKDNNQFTKPSYLPVDSLTKQQVNKRIKIVAAANIVGYSAVMAGLYSAWYKDYPQSSFHVFNDFDEWMQMDKIGHMYSAYTAGKLSMELWRWTGMERKKRIWIGGMSGAFYMTVIEVLDGFSAEWGWSWGDFTANMLGSGIMVAQELAWDEQRLQLKFSSHVKNYSDPTLDLRSDELFGTTTAQRVLKDYNGQTYWLSCNVRSFFPKSRFPAWLNISIGTGAEGMFGATENIGTDENGNVTFDRTDIKRYRQWYLAPDIDLTKIKTKSVGLRYLFTLLNVVKFPMPALEFSNGKIRFNPLAF